MYRRVAYDRVGGYEYKINEPEDYGLFRKMVFMGFDAKKAASTLLEYRQHSDDQVNERLGSYIYQQYLENRISDLTNEVAGLKNNGVINYYLVTVYKKIKKLKNITTKKITSTLQRTASIL